MLRSWLAVAIESVVESSFVISRALCVAKCFLTQTSQPAVDFKIDASEIVELAGEIENLLHQRSSHCKRLRIGLLIKLANV